MQFHIRSCFLLALVALLICTSAAPLDTTDDVTQREASVVDSNNLFAFLNILPRLARKLGGGGGGSSTHHFGSTGPAKNTPNPVKETPKPPKETPNSAKETPKTPAHDGTSKSAHVSSKPTPHVTTTKTHGGSTTTPGPSTTSTSFPPKCSADTCGGKGACAGGAKRTANETTAQLEKRNFVSIPTKGLLPDFPADDNHHDLSTFADSQPQWIPFGDEAQIAFVRDLVGCSVVAAMSEKGMIVTHLWEDGPGANTAGTLHPRSYKNTLKKVQSSFANQKTNLANGEVIVMLPVNSDGKKPGARRYDTEPWQKVVDGKKTKESQMGPTIAQDIINMAHDATGIQPTVKTYPISAVSSKKDPGYSDISISFVAQYDPRNQAGAKPHARQAWTGGQAVLPNVPQW